MVHYFQHFFIFVTHRCKTLLSKVKLFILTYIWCESRDSRKQIARELRRGVICLEGGSFELHTFYVAHHERDLALGVGPFFTLAFSVS